MIVRIHSHRARDKMRGALGRRTKSFFSFWQAGEWHQIEDVEYAKLAGIKGITKSKLPHRALPHWGQEEYVK